MDGEIALDLSISSFKIPAHKVVREHDGFWNAEKYCTGRNCGAPCDTGTDAESDRRLKRRDGSNPQLGQVLAKPLTTLAAEGRMIGDKSHLRTRRDGDQGVADLRIYYQADSGNVLTNEHLDRIYRIETDFSKFLGNRCGRRIHPTQHSIVEADCQAQR